MDTTLVAATTGSPNGKRYVNLAAHRPVSASQSHFLLDWENTPKSWTFPLNKEN